MYSLRIKTKLKSNDTAFTLIDKNYVNDINKNYDIYDVQLLTEIVEM